MPPEEGKPKKKAKPQWTYVKTITEDVLNKVITEESKRRVAVMEEERNSIKDKILASSKLYAMLSSVKGVTLIVKHEVPTYKNADVMIEASIDDQEIDGGFEECIKLPPELKRKLTSTGGLAVDFAQRKEAAQTIAAYVIMEMENNPSTDLLSAVSKHVNEWLSKV